MNRYFLHLAILCYLLSCKGREFSSSNWTELELRSGWFIGAPKEFQVEYAQGVDSYPGYIESKKNNFYLEFDSGDEGELINCDKVKQYQAAKAKIDTGWYKHFYQIPEKHVAQIKTINNKVAIIVTPTRVGEGTTAVSLTDCQSGSWIGISGKNLSLEQQKLVLEMFNNIAFKIQD